MDDLRQQLVDILQGRVCLVGVGNVEYGDDGLGVRLAKRFARVLDARKTKGHARTSGSPDLGETRDAPFPLTPTLSLREREESPSRWDQKEIIGASVPPTAVKAKARDVPQDARHSNPRAPGFPLPQGEGWGEGEESVGRQGGFRTVCRRSSIETILAGTTPEDHISRLASGSFEKVLLLDALDFGGSPGAVVLLDSSETSSRFPQISTHKLSLGLLAGLIESSSRTKVWLLGVQPESLAVGGGLTPKVRATMELLAGLLAEAAQEAHKAYRPLPHRCPSELSALPC